MYFGRDFLGRRSLLWHFPKTNAHSFIISSVSCDAVQWEEVPTTGLFSFDLNIGFKNHVDLKSQMKHLEWNQGFLKCPSMCINFSTNPDINESELSIEKFSETYNTQISQLLRTLDAATRLRIVNIPNPDPGHARLAVLFSGGLDCTILAALAHMYIPIDEPIDLLNVAFENPRISSFHKQNENDQYCVPDRKTARQGCIELKKICSSREWRLVEINIPYSEVLEKKSHILSVMNPSNTVMDFSISLAFWFASRGEGLVEQTKPYKSRSKVLFSGLGADEQMGGYSRHKVSFAKSSWHGLLKEIQLDVSRISKRNLGRDCRIIGDHGKEVRFPYLDEDVYSLLTSLPVFVKTDPRFVSGGDKLILRCVADKLGLEITRNEKKRAIQFGARTAKMEANEKGGDLIFHEV